MRPLSLTEVTVSVIAEEEWSPVKGAFDSGVPDYREEEEALEKEILDRLSKGDDWAWCSIKVTVEWENHSASTYLGCCSYESEEDFKQDAYFHEMVEVALTELNHNLQQMAEKLRRFT